MKVMYLIWSLGYGGAEKMLLSLASEHGPGVEPLVCCLDDVGCHAHHLVDRGIKVIPLNKKRGFDISVLGKLRNIVRDERVDIINSHLWSANLYARLLKCFVSVPVVVDEHNVDLWKKWYHFAIDRLLAPKADGYIFVSQAVREFYRMNVPGALRKHKVIYNGIDLTPFRQGGDIRGDLLAHFSALADARLLVNVGRLVEAKDQAELVRITRTLVDKGYNVYTLIVGDGPLRGELEREVAATGMQSRVWLTGSRDDVPLILKSCDLFVLPSRWEGLPLVILETMCAGTPPVFYDVGGTAEFVRDGEDGIKVPAGNTEAILAALERLLSSQGEIDRLADNFRQRGMEGCDTVQMVRAYERLFFDMLESNKTGAR
ncbi:glycosyltransferase [Geobacter argillaceus]|uniref:Glycosyltransferase involved in cell wall biosynthesis n=1 Tax=Geobacter argillaceus TaxID=345631 RepID=A0A562VHD8_9BACT|nr:glycosyltransferase [Geobacter argillaceus]TWJ17319.1 glycosyltransferase involved in cell wall biosynthesis [Geobacter argillaceus]